MIKCPNCNAELSYNVESEKVKCDYCGSTFDAKELETKVKVAEEHENKEIESFEGKSYCCSECGATLLTFDDTAITFCSYCGSQAMIESKMIKTNNPDFVIPFSKTKEECIENYKKKIKRTFFAPSYMKSDIVVSKFRGIFMPYGIYKLSFHDTCTNKGSTYAYRSGDYKIYYDYSIACRVDTEYEGLSYDLSSRFYDKYSHAIPFDFKGCEDFNINYLSGFYADTKDVEYRVYNKEVEEIVRTDCSRRLLRERKFKKYGCYNPKVPITVSESKVGMFPVYFLAIRNEKKKTVNYAVVNGQTGKVAFDNPIAFGKYILATIILSIIIFFIINSNVLLLPRTVLIFSIGASLLSFIVSNNQLNKLHNSRLHYDDLGFKSVNEESNEETNEVNLEKTEQTKIVNNKKSNDSILKFILMVFGFVMFPIFIPAIMVLLIENPSLYSLLTSIFPWIILVIVLIIILSSLKKTSNNKGTNKVKKKRAPFIYKMTNYLYKQIIAIGIGITVLVLNPVDDIYYYSSAILSFLLTILSFYDLVSEHNNLVSSILPQLEKRGGDEHE